MKNTKIFSVLTLLAIAVGVCHEAEAQTMRRVEVTKAYSPEVSAATKLLAPTVINDTPVIEPDIEYDVKPDTWSTTLSAHDFRPAKATYWDFTSPKHFYLQADAGYPLSSDLLLRYAMHSVRLGYFGVGVTHSGDYAARLSADGIKRSMANSLSMRNGIDVNGGLFVGDRLLEGYATYEHSLFNRYATLAPASLNFHDANISVRFGDNFANLKRLNFSVEAHGGYWAHRLPVAVADISGYGEASVGASAKMARLFNGKNRVELTAVYDMWLGGDVYRDTRFGVDVEYARKFKYVHVEAGVGYMYDKVNGRNRASHFITPHAKVLFDLKLNAFTPYVEVDTRVGHNSLSSLYKRNPYIDFAAMTSKFGTMANDLNYNMTLGFSGNVHTRFAYRAYIGMSFVRNELKFYVNQNGTFAATNDSDNRVIYGVELEYLPIGGLRLGGGIFGYIDTDKPRFVTNAPTYDANVFAEYTLRRWQFGVNADFIGKRRWSGVANENGVAPIAFMDKGDIDLGVRVNYRVSNMVDIYAEGINLLNSQIYDYAYYYRSGIGFKAGIKLEF